MTIQELYAEIGGSYEQAVKIMKLDKMIDRYVRRLKSSSFDDQLAAASESMDPSALFETAHAMKGVCANLGLVKLAEAAHVITEEFRPGAPRTLSDDEVCEKLKVLKDLYRKTIEGINRYEGNA